MFALDVAVVVLFTCGST